jgi:SAM-dependent methyltransferase
MKCHKINYTPKGHIILAEAEKTHFWFVTRKEYITTNIQKYPPKGKKIADYGGGTGDIAHHLQNAGYEVTLYDYYEEGLKIAKSRGIKKVKKIDLNAPLPPKQYDVVCAFDVIEHFENDTALLKQFNKSLKKDGVIYITVPAHPLLWQKTDIIGGHYRRYNRKTMTKLLTETGYEILTVKHFFVMTLPLLLLRKILDKFKIRKQEHEEIKINKTINNILKFITRIENKILKNSTPKLGGSLFAAARKTTP